MYNDNVLEFNKYELEVIKQAEQIIIKNLNTLDEGTRSRLFSRLQNITYKKIGFYETDKFGILAGVSAFYAPKEETIYIVDDDDRNNCELDILVHEMIHFITAKEDIDVHLTGFRKAYKTSYGYNLFAYYNDYNGLNEGLTEFFTEDFLNQKSRSAYLYELQVIKILSAVCGKENFKKFYFNNDINGFKNLIKNKYHLQDYKLIDKLLHYIDFNVNSLTDNPFDLFKQPIVKCIYETLLQMEINRRYYEENKMVILSDDEIREYLNSFNSSRNQVIIDNIIKNKFKNLYDTVKKNKHDSHNYDNLTAKLINAIAENNDIMLYFYVYGLGAKKLNIIENLNRTSIYVKNNIALDKTNIFKAVLEFFSDKNGKINLDKLNNKEKYEFITNVLYSTNKTENFYKYFSSKDLIEYINNDLKEYKLFCNNGAMSYIYNDFDKVSPNVKGHKDFIDEYNNLKYGTRKI